MGITRGGRFNEIGSTGLSTWGGYIEQAYIAELTWPRVASTYNRIWRSDPEVTIARNLYGALAGKVKVGWEFPEERGNKELPKPTKADEEFLDFLYSVNDDIEGGISQWVTDCITRTPFYGYGLWEVVLGLRRKGWKSDGWESQENDDLTGIRSLAFRDYATFQRWHLDDKNGRPTAWEQNDPPNPITPIPLSRCLHIRYGDLSNPEGLATLEAMYRLERYKFNLEIVQGIGYEHTAGFLYYEADRAITPADETHLNRGARFVLTAQEGNYLATPGGIKAMFIDTPFGAAANILETIKHYSVLKLALLGLQFVAISTMTGSGSYAALDDSSSVAMLMYNSMTAGFARQAGQQIVDQMLKANPGAFGGITRKPIMTISPIAKTAALAELAQFVTAMNAIRPLGDDDLVSIRRQSEVLPVTLPEVEEMPEPDPPTVPGLPDEPEQPVANEGDVMTTPDEGDNVAMMRPFDHHHAELSGPAQTGDTAIDPQLKNYYDDLDSLSRQAIAGEIDQQTFEEKAQNIAIAAMLLAFILGGGNPESPGARAIVGKQRAIALKSVTDLSNDIYSGKFSEQSANGKVIRTAGKGRELLALRLGLFAVTVYGLYNLGKMFRGDDTKITTRPDGTTETVSIPKRLKWKRGPTEQGCRDCVALHNVTLTTQEWQRLHDAGLFPQSNDLECKGYNCLCSLNETSEESMGIDNVLRMLGV